MVARKKWVWPFTLPFFGFAFVLLAGWLGEIGVGTAVLGTPSVALEVFANSDTHYGGARGDVLRAAVPAADIILVISFASVENPMPVGINSVIKALRRHFKPNNRSGHDDLPRPEAQILGIEANTLAELRDKVRSLEIPVGAKITRILWHAHGSSATQENLIGAGEEASIGLSSERDIPVSVMSFGPAADGINLYSTRNGELLILPRDSDESRTKNTGLATDFSQSVEGLADQRGPSEPIDATAVLKPLQAHFADDVHVVCDSCNILAGPESLVDQRMKILADFFGIKTGTIYANVTKGATFHPSYQCALMVCFLVAGVAVLANDPDWWAALIALGGIPYSVYLDQIRRNLGYEAQIQNGQIVRAVRTSYMKSIAKFLGRSETCTRILRAAGFAPF